MLEPLAPGLADVAIRAVLAFTITTGWLLVLRRPWRRVFGAGSTYMLWSALPLALIVASLPLADSRAPFMSIATSLREATSAAAARVTHTPAGVDAGAALAMAWLVGSVLALAWHAVAQWRYQRALRDAGRLPDHAGIPVLKASRPDLGPAQVGILRPRIVLPADFDERFASGERALVLDHEATHARRRDALWAALAHGLACAFWFHPFAWWALRAFRTDQELACDAAVVQRQPSSRRVYAEALLKNHAMVALPAGCPWPSRHPLMERIAMLKQSPSRRRRTLALVALPFALAGVTATAWSAAPTPAAGKPQYQVEARIASNDGNDAHVTVCAYENQPATVTPTAVDGKPAWKVAFTVVPSTEPGMLDVTIDSASDHDHHLRTSREILRVTPNASADVVYSDKADSGLRSIDIIPTTGCPAAAKAHA
ncbi:M56 family metallopeptidase [Bacillus sp. NP157]|nr:M56 family metallopeptidase [Bacillus sp. NP157]